MSRRKHKTKTISKSNNYDYIQNLNITDFDKFYEDVVLTYNKIRPSSIDFINHICTVGNGSALKSFLTDVETYHDITLDVFANRIFKNEITEFFNILKTHIGENNTNFDNIIHITYDVNSSLNTELTKHDITKFIIISKASYMYEMRNYDPNFTFHNYLYVTAMYSNIIDNTDMSSSFGYGITTPFVEIASYLNTFKRLPVTKREWASISSHPFDY